MLINAFCVNMEVARNEVECTFHQRKSQKASQTEASFLGIQYQLIYFSGLTLLGAFGCLFYL